jgi:hypothetical protein
MLNTDQVDYLTAWAEQQEEGTTQEESHTEPGGLRWWTKQHGLKIRAAAAIESARWFRNEAAGQPVRYDATDH